MTIFYDIIINNYKRGRIPKDPTGNIENLEKKN